MLQTMHGNCLAAETNLIFRGLFDAFKDAKILERADA